MKTDQNQLNRQKTLLNLVNGQNIYFNATKVLCFNCDNTPIDSFIVRMRNTPKPYRVVLLEFRVKIFLLDKTMAYTCAVNNCSNRSYWLKN